MTALLLAVVPLWFGKYLPMVDLPQHAGQIAALHELRSGNSNFSAVFEINWFTPYLFGYVLLYAISTFLPIGIAIKLVVCACIISIPLLTGVLLREVGADVRWRWLAIPGSYSFAFYWGFISFMVAVPIALLLLIMTVRFDREPTLTRAVLLAAFTLFLFFCHVIALGLSGLAASAYIVGRHHGNIKAAIVRLVPLVAPLPLIGLWLVATYQSEAAVQDAPVIFGSVLERLSALVLQPSGFEQFTAFGVLVTLVIVLAPPAFGARMTLDPARWLPFLVALLVVLTAPSSAMHTGFLYQRLGVFLVPFWLMIWDAPRNDSYRLELLCMAIVAVWLALNTARFASFARETQAFDEIMDSMEPGQNVAMMIVDKSSGLFSTPVYLHFPAWYQATRHGIVDFNFADFHPQIVRYKGTRGPRIGESLAWAPWKFQWDRDGGKNYRYFVVKANRDVSSSIFKERIHSVSVRAHNDRWWLYESNEGQ